MKSTKTASLPHRDAWFFLAAFLVAPLLILALCLGSWIPALAAALCALGALLLWFFCYRGRAGTPDSLMYAFIFLLVRLWLGGRQRVQIEDEALRELEGPYILLANHESFEDFYYISQMAQPRRPSYLVNEYYCTRPVLKTMARRGGILSKKLFTPDLAAPVGILRMIRRGYPVVIFPEGRLSPDGRGNRIVESGAALYRRLKAALVLVRIDGAYYAHPKWRKKRFRSEIRLSVRRVLQPEELAKLPNQELDELIRRELWNDAAGYAGRPFPRKDRALGLEGLLYRCADCGALYQTEGVGNELRCRACGSVRRLDERYRFPEPLFGANGGPVRWETGVCTLDARAFRYRSAAEDFSVPTEKLPALAFSCGEEFELYHDNELHYFYPLEERLQVARWALAADLLAEKRFAQQEGAKNDGKD